MRAARPRSSGGKRERQEATALWKHTLIQMTMYSLKNVTPDVQQIIDRAVLRLEKRINALKYDITCSFCKSESRSTAPNLKHARRKLKGIGHVLDSGKLELHPELSRLITNASL